MLFHLGASLAALGVLPGRILRLQRLLRVEGLQIFRSQGKRLGIPTEIGIRVVGKTGASGDVDTLLVGSDTQELGVVSHRLLQHGIEEFEYADVVVIHRMVGAEYSESPAAHGDILNHRMTVASHQLDKLLHIFLLHMVEVELEHVGRFEEVGKLSAVSVHERRNRDGRHLRLVLVGKLLADGEALAVSLGHHSKLRARGNHALEIQPVGEWMALRRFDTREVRWHRGSPIHAVV